MMTDYELLRQCRSRYRIWLMLIINLAISISSFSQAAKSIGRIAGKCLDQSNNEPLNAVSINPVGRSNGTTSITDGSFILPLPAGTYSIRFSYTGYQTKEISGIVVKAGETTDLNILLQTASKQMENVVVTATVKKESLSSVYSAQKRSAAASDGISIEAIRKTPDNNAGQILKRVTGVNVQDNRFVVVRGLGDQYNQTMLNGVPMTSTESNRNAFAFDLIPAAVIDNITINKTATPDMPGNFAGGIVQINTKDFPSSDFFSVTLQGGFADKTINQDFYNDKRADLEILGFGAGKRALPTNFPTQTSRVSILSLNNQERTRYLQQLNNNLAPVNYGKTGWNENVQFGYGKTFKLKNESQFGIVAALNQRRTQLREEEVVVRDGNLAPLFKSGGSTNPLEFNYYSENVRYRYAIDFGGVVNLAYRFGTNKITLKNLATQVYTNQYIDRNFLVSSDAGQGLSSGLRQIGISHIVEQKSIVNSILAGEHRTGKNNETRLDWNVNLSTIKTIAPDTRNFIITTDSVRSFYSIDEGVSSIQLALRGFSRIWSEVNDKVYGGAFNATSPFTLGKQKQLFKAGILFQERNRKSVGTVLPVAGFRASTIDSLFSPSNYAPINGGHLALGQSSVAGGAANYLASSGLLAAYESLENKIGKKTRVIWGIRAESYQQSVNVGNITYAPGFVDPDYLPANFASRTEFNFLPSVNIIYSPTAKINIRGAYSNTVIRPDLKDIAEFLYFDFETFTVRKGNRDLKSSSIQNLDLKFEWFPSAAEIFSASIFYKNIQDPIEYIRPELLNASVRQPLNIGTATVKGIEAEFRKKLDFVNSLPWMQHVTLFGNGSLIRSKVPDTDVASFLAPFVSTHKLSGQPDYIVNAGITIALFKNNFETTFSYNRTGDYIAELGTPKAEELLAGGTNTRTPIFRVRARDIGDLVFTQNFYKNKGKLKLNISNLFRARYILYQDINANGKFDDPVIVKKTGINAYQIQSNYASGTDNTASSITPQRVYSFSISYTF